MTAEEFNRQKADTSIRFYIDEDPGVDCQYVIIDRYTGKIVGSDNAEPEDKLLCRDYYWIAELLNKVAQEAAVLRAALVRICHERDVVPHALARLAINKAYALAKGHR